MKEKKQSNLIDVLLLYGGLGLFLITLSVIYTQSAYYMNIEGFGPSKAIMYSFGESYMIVMLMLFCLGYYRLRKMSAKQKELQNKSNQNTK